MPSVPPFIKHVLYKGLYYLLIWFVAITIAWIIPRLLPFNAVEVTVATIMRTYSQSSSMIPPQEYKAMVNYVEGLFGANLPPWIQYLRFWENMYHGYLGTSIVFFPMSVNQLIAETLPYDLILIIPSTVVAWIIGNILGAQIGYRKTGTFVDRASMLAFIAINNIPFFVLGLLLILLFAVYLHWLPPTGYTYTAIPRLTWGYLPIFLRHWILPFASVAIVSLGGWTLGMRQLIINEKNSDYMNYGEALGLRPSILSKYAMKNAFLPQITGLALSLGSVVGGSYVLEFIFGYPGMGYIMGVAATSNDYVTVAGVFVVITTVVLLANYIVDILYSVLDPRVRAAEVGA
ncbi:MAG: ABC transporter permease [Acidilobus sp.]